MDLNKLYKLQEELDNHIWQKHNTLERMTKVELLDSTILALLVELGELANTTRCFKHWSTKGMMDKEIILDELADVWHFYLSIGNQFDTRETFASLEYDDYFIKSRSIVDVLLNINYWVNALTIKSMTAEAYSNSGSAILMLGHKLGFTDKEVEQAYLKKHEKNYRRQEEGY